MNEAIEYAEMLEIPVSTVNVIRKKRGKKRKAEQPQPVEPLEQQEELSVGAEQFAESVNSQERVEFDGTERIDTVLVYSAYDKPFLGDGKLRPRDYPVPDEDLEEGYAVYYPTQKADRKTRIALAVEFTAACALCGTIFLTNIFMPSSAINTFFRFLSESTQQTDARTYTDFTLSPVVSEFSNAELTLTENGVLTFKSACHVYPAVDGTVTSVTKTEGGYYSVKIAHSGSFTGVIDGLQQCYYTEGDTVKANVPVGYTDGETEVQVTMYSFGELLNCFELTDENCLAWTTQE